MNGFQVIAPADIGGLSFDGDPYAPDLANVPLSRPQLTLAMLDGQRVRACFSLWWDGTPMVDGKPSLCLGHLYAETEMLARQALRHLDEVARARDLVRPVLAPMDGATWFPYRLTLETAERPPFFLERSTAPFWPALFEAVGFALVARYHSSETQRLIYADRTADVWVSRIADGALSIRAFDRTRGDEDLKALYALSVESFARNLFYTPISEDDFLALYRGIVPVLVPELVLMAFDGDELVGFVFAVPDYAQRQRGETVDTVIVKTGAVRRGRAYAGLGGYLGHLVHRRAAERGFTRAIHAFYHEDNLSRAISDKSGHIMRTYGLYGRG